MMIRSTIDRIFIAGMLSCLIKWSVQNERNKKIKNVIVFISGISGIGKRTIGDAICKLDPSFKNVTPDDWMSPILRLLGENESTLYSLTAEGWSAVNRIVPQLPH